LEKGVGTWSRNKGGGGIDIVGCPDIRSFTINHTLLYIQPYIHTY